MLEEAVAAARSGDSAAGEAPEDWTPQITIGTPVLIPETYVADLNVRLGLYRRIAALVDRREIDGFAAELIDRFGAAAGRGREPARDHRDQAALPRRRHREGRGRPEGRGAQLPPQPLRQPRRASSTSCRSRWAPRSCARIRGSWSCAPGKPTRSASSACAGSSSSSRRSRQRRRRRPARRKSATRARPDCCAVPASRQARRLFEASPRSGRAIAVRRGGRGRRAAACSVFEQIENREEELRLPARRKPHISARR